MKLIIIITLITFNTLSSEKFHIALQESDSKFQVVKNHFEKTINEINFEMLYLLSEMEDGEFSISRSGRCYAENQSLIGRDGIGAGLYSKKSLKYVNTNQGPLFPAHTKESHFLSILWNKNWFKHTDDYVQDYLSNFYPVIQKDKYSIKVNGESSQYLEKERSYNFHGETVEPQESGYSTNTENIEFRKLDSLYFSKVQGKTVFSFDPELTLSYEYYCYFWKK